MRTRKFLCALLTLAILITGTVSVFASAEDMRSAYSAKQYEKAIVAADKVLSEAASYMDAYYVKAMSCFHSGNVKGAYDALAAQLKLNPKNELALYNAACTASLLKLQDESVNLLERLFVLDVTKKSDVKKDSDFDNIRDNNKYKKLMGISVVFGGELLDFDVAPILTDGRTLLPLRKIFEAFDADVSYMDETQTVKAEKDRFSLELVIGAKTAIVNGETKTLDVPAQILNDRTLVPVRFISESLGATVDWDGDNEVVSILTKVPNGSADYATTKSQLDALLAVLPVDGIFIEPYLMESTEGMTLIVFKDAKGLELFNTLSTADKSKFVSETVYQNYALVIGCDPIHVKVIYDGRTYYEGEFNYDARDKLPLTYYEKGKHINVVKQYKDSFGGNYKDFYLLPESEQTTSKVEVPSSGITTPTLAPTVTPTPPTTSQGKYNYSELSNNDMKKLKDSYNDLLQNFEKSSLPGLKGDANFAKEIKAKSDVAVKLVNDAWNKVVTTKILNLQINSDDEYTADGAPNVIQEKYMALVKKAGLEANDRLKVSFMSLGDGSVTMFLDFKKTDTHFVIPVVVGANNTIEILQSKEMKEFNLIN